MFVIAGAAQPAMAQNNPDQAPEEPAEEENERDEEVVTPDDEENESTEEDENTSNQNQKESAQFDARLGTAINTLDSLVEIAPNEQARTGIESALNELRNVQNDTETASSAAGEQPTTPESEAPEENVDESNGQNSENQGPPEDRGPSENSNRPGFVNEMLGGIFG